MCERGIIVKDLEKTQKMFKVLKVLATIAMVFSFVGLGIMLISFILLAVFDNAEIMQMFAEEAPGASKELILSSLLSVAVMLLVGTIISVMSVRYLKSELADGTPFTARGAGRLKTLGILSIVLPIAAAIVSSVIYVCFGVEDSGDFSASVNISMGIFLLMSALVMRYGAGVEQRRIQLEQYTAALVERNAELEKRVAELERTPESPQEEI